MRVLLISWNAFNDPGSGAARSFRTKAAWLAEAGHEVVALCAAGFEGLPSVSLSDHLGSLGVHSPGRFLAGSRNLARYAWRGVDVNFLCTSTAKGGDPEPSDVTGYIAHVHRLIRETRPQLTLCYGMHRATHEGKRLAKKAGSRINFNLYNFGYENRSYFEHADRVTTDSAFLSTYYYRAIGLRSFVISGPIEPEEVVFSEGARNKVVFVNPTPRKGSSVVARLAEMLRERRPDVKMMVVCSMTSKEEFTANLSQETADWIEFVGPFDSPKDYLQHARMILVPSLAEALGRVCIEAMMNGIPCIGVDHGGVPEAMAGTGINLPIPKSLAAEPEKVPEAEEIENWYAAILELWDNEAKYTSHVHRCEQVAATKWTVEAQKERVLSYFEAIAQGR